MKPPQEWRLILFFFFKANRNSWSNDEIESNWKFIEGVRKNMKNKKRTRTKFEKKIRLNDEIENKSKIYKRAKDKIYI